MADIKDAGFLAAMTELRCLREEHDRVRIMLDAPRDDLNAMAGVIGAHALADMAYDRSVEAGVRP